MRRVARLLVLTLALGACASAGGGTSSRDRNRIGQEEIAQSITRSSASTALDLIQQLRPHFLRGGSRTITGNPTAVVYQDGARLGEVDLLGSIRALHIETIEFLSASSATITYGTNHPAGAILITTRKPGTN